MESRLDSENLPEQSLRRVGFPQKIIPLINLYVCLEKLRELQENLIRSHAAGVGKALTPEKTRMLLALR